MLIKCKWCGSLGCGPIRCRFSLQSNRPLDAQESKSVQPVRSTDSGKERTVGTHE
jgi:hypothetical protein